MSFMWRTGSTTWEVSPLSIPDIKLIRTAPFVDQRGYFVESYQRARYAAAGIHHEFIQDNQAGSIAAGTVRGLHFQMPPFAQTKLLRVLRGRIFDVVVDLRRWSPSYGRSLAVELADDTGEQLLIPAGFAHGYCTLVPNTEVFYKVDNDYSREHERGVNWADPELAIDWPIVPAEAVLCDRDREFPMLCDLPTYFD